MHRDSIQMLDVTVAIPRAARTSVSSKCPAMTRLATKGVKKKVKATLLGHAKLMNYMIIS
jgi:hypothetical protein